MRGKDLKYSAALSASVLQAKASATAASAGTLITDGKKLDAVWEAEKQKICGSTDEGH